MEDSQFNKFLRQKSQIYWLSLSFTIGRFNSCLARSGRQFSIWTVKFSSILLSKRLVVVLEAQRESRLLLHLLEDRNDHVKSRSLARILIHADPDQLGHVWGHPGADVQPQSLRGNLHADLHGGEVTEGHLPHAHLPQHDRVAPHVRCSTVNIWWTLL